ncbi:MAG TPA: M12 family metallo-peptidase [Candidatus Kapabacteria bacterium]|nr:M12 family metallo-peptidase [Candidatus Kapabacteria bacterium]
MNYRIFLFLSLTFLWSNVSEAAPGIISASKFLNRSQPASLSVASQGTGYIVDGAALAKALAVGGHIQITEFPGGAGDLVTLDLKSAHSPIDSTTQFWIGSSEGARRYTPPAFSAFRGKVLGEPDSRVFLTTFAGKLLVTITRESGVTYDFGPAKNSEVPGAHILIPENSLFAYGQFHALNCIAGDIPQPNAPEPAAELLKKYRSNGSGALGTLSHSQLLQVDIAVEADSAFYYAAGNDTNLVLGYIASLFAMSSSIYEDEVNITWHLTWVKLWPKDDPYNVKGNAYGLIDTVPKYWRAHYANVPRDLAHVLTSVSNGGGGYGYYSICDTNWSYSMSSPQTGHQYPTFAFTYDAYIIAHEVGHNFSLVHTEECYWDPPLDTCFTKDDTIWGLQLGDACDKLPIHPKPNPGSIMSYCANANYAIHHDSIQYFQLRMTFTPKVDSVLRLHAEQSACIQPPVDKTLILLSPRGSETYPGDTTITIQWTYANLDSVTLEYSPDGSSWNTIAQGLPASTGSHQWIVPNIASSNMLVRAIDAADPALADTSLLFFTVTPSSAVTAPESEDGFQLSPNPARDYLTLTGGTVGERIAYSIVNIEGVNILSGTAVTAAPVLRIDLPSMADGTYYLRLTSPITRVFPFILSK